MFYGVIEDSLGKLCADEVIVNFVVSGEYEWYNKNVPDCLVSNYKRSLLVLCHPPPVNSVGVMGDERTYEKVVALRAVESTDGMTADWVDLPYKFLQKTSNKIINQVKGVNRVVYDISSKPPATIEWE